MSALDSVLADFADRMQTGDVPWRKVWTSTGSPAMPVRADGQPFSGANALLLAMAAFARGYAGGAWFTYKQAQALGAQVRRGESSTPAILYKVRTLATANDNGDGDGPDGGARGGGAYLRAYGVFHAAQIDGLPEHFYIAPDRIPSDEYALPPELADVPARILHDGSDPAYYPEADVIRMPPPEAFASAEDYVGTLAHELFHFSAGPGRIDRGLERYHLSIEARAEEELVAEIGSVLAALRFGVPISETVMANHAAYVASWARHLKDKPSALLKAAGQAQRALDFLVELSAEAKGQREAQEQMAALPLAA